MDGEEERRIICQTVPKSAEFSADDMVQMNRLLVACQGVLIDQESEGSPGQLEIQALLASLGNGYGCWLDTVEAAILNAVGLDPIDQAALFGSFSMAKCYLFAISQAQDALAAQAMPSRE